MKEKTFGRSNNNLFKNEDCTEKVRLLKGIYLFQPENNRRWQSEEKMLRALAPDISFGELERSANEVNVQTENLTSKEKQKNQAELLILKHTKPQKSGKTN
ncbi:MAG: hypothetical protein HRK26_00925 [Rickettsiaceae bacterium H1]|nr:hypothetical protein [Rickettsiaceae bacterium H1]